VGGDRNPGELGGSQRAWNWHRDGDRRLFITQAGMIPRRKRLLLPGVALVRRDWPENDDNVNGLTRSL